VIYLFGPFDNVYLEFKMNRAWILTLGLALAVPLCRELTAPAVARVCHWIAKYSYGIYLSHSIVFWAVLRPMGTLPLAIRIVVLVVATVTVPIAAYHLIGVRIPMMSISHSDLMPIRSERSDAGLSQFETVIDIRQDFSSFSSA
jgi:peptidoglycan/LPS O-acetylase OafA/YrhL